MSTILDSFKALVTPELIKQVSGSVGESEESVGKGLASAAPALLMGLLNKSNDSSAMEKVMGLIGHADNDGDMNSGVEAKMGLGQKLLEMLFGGGLGGITTLLGGLSGLKGGAMGTLMTLAAPMVLNLLKGRLAGGDNSAGGLASLLTGEKDGILAAAPTGLAALLDPMGALKGMVSGLGEKAGDAVEGLLGGLGGAAAAVGGVAAAAGGAVAGAAGDAVDAAKNLVGDAKDAVSNVAEGVGDAAKSVVGGAADLAGKAVDTVGDAASAVGGAVAGAAGGAVDAAKNVAGAAGNAVGGLPRWVIPAALAALAIAALAYTQCNKPADTTTSTGTGSSMGSSGDASMSATGQSGTEGAATPDAAQTPAPSGNATVTLTDIELPGGIKLKGAETGIEKGLIGFIQDATRPVDKKTWFNFDRLLFDTGKASLKPESKDQIANMVAILKAFPNVNIKIGGYTDNTGTKEGNMKLSADRATTVMNAITIGGIAKDRVEAEGYGDQHPVASNDTEEGRAKNRRIAVLVTKK